RGRFALHRRPRSRARVALLLQRLTLSRAAGLERPRDGPRGDGKLGATDGRSGVGRGAAGADHRATPGPCAGVHARARARGLAVPARIDSGLIAPTPALLARFWRLPSRECAERVLEARARRGYSWRSAATGLWRIAR